MITWSVGGIGVNYDVSLEDLDKNEGVADIVSHSQKTSAEPTLKPKKSRLATEISWIKEVLGEIGQKTDNHLTTLAEGIGYEAHLEKVRNGAYEQLGDIPG